MSKDKISLRMLNLRYLFPIANIEYKNGKNMLLNTDEIFFHFLNNLGEDSTLICLRRSA